MDSRFTREARSVQRHAWSCASVSPSPLIYKSHDWAANAANLHSAEVPVQFDGRTILLHSELVEVEIRQADLCNIILRTQFMRHCIVEKLFDRRV